MKKILLFSLFFISFFVLLSLNNKNQALAACSSTTCNDNLTGPSCNGTSCRTQGDYCSAGVCVHGWAGGGPATGCLNDCQPPTPTPVPPSGCTSSSQCAYCEFCTSTTGGSCVPYTNGCPVGGPTPTPMPAGSCPAGQSSPYMVCQGTSGGPTGGITYACVSTLGLAGFGGLCGVDQCSTSQECANLYCPVGPPPPPPPPPCTPTTSCAAQSANCGSIFDGCNTVSCGTCSLGSVCQGNTCVSLNSISGNVFVDQNKDQLQNGTDTNYTGGITITPSGGTVTYPSSGTYQVSGLTAGTYTISLTNLPVGYQMTYPLNGPPPSFSVTVGPSCSVSGSNSASCDANGNITTLRYGITNSVPWWQSTGGDVTGPNNSSQTGGGFTDNIPQGATCGPYASLTGSGGSPGVIYAGYGSVDLGQGQASQNPYNWIVGGLTYPEVYVPLTAGIIRTSYNYVSSVAQQSNLTPVNISSYCGGGGIASCQLSSSLPNGLYIANGDLTLTGASYTFPANKKFVILVNGDLNINTEIHVPIGSVAFFTASRDINVASSVGEAVISSTRANVEGYYSADRNFTVQGINSCPTVDRRLNVAGSIVVNAALNGGSFVSQRDLCAGDLQCPVFQIQERPDFVLNSPEFLKTVRRVWQEIAP